MELADKMNAEPLFIKLIVLFKKLLNSVFSNAGKSREAPYLVYPFRANSLGGTKESYLIPIPCLSSQLLDPFFIL